MAAIVRLQRILNVGNQLYQASRTSQVLCGLFSRLKSYQAYDREQSLFAPVRCRTQEFGRIRCLSTQQKPAADNASTTSDASSGADRLEFQAETRMLLDIVAKSLYSEKEVFIRELISNASDALEKLRYERLAVQQQQQPEGTEPHHAALEIRIDTDKMKRIFSIQDSGIGMTREELIQNLGTIARSGSKAFLQQLQEKSGEESSSIIGQFGVGFYSSFMVAEKVEVFTRAAFPADAPGYQWSSDGSGTYEIQQVEGVEPGTKIVLHLKPESREFSDEDAILGVIKKYSNFVGSPIYVNGKQANTIQPLWLMEPKEVTPQMHDEFYRFVGNSHDRPRFAMHYKTDAPLSIRALLYFPEGKPGLFELSRDGDVGVALYSRKVLIKSKTDNILPKWLRFVKGVVDSEDIPLNLSRELLQNSSLIGKLRTVLTNRVLRFLLERAAKEPEQFDLFYRDYGLFLKEGIVTGEQQLEKEEIAKLLRFESSKKPAGEKVTLPEYCSRLKEGQRDIFYLAAPSRALAEASPYFEAVRQRDMEVLFCYEPYDELVIMQLRQFDSRTLASIEREMRKDREKAEDVAELGPDSLNKISLEALQKWMRAHLAGRANAVTVTQRLDSHPCVVTVEEMAAARHFVRTQSHQLTEEARYSLLQPRLEINPRHPIIKKLSVLTESNPRLAELVTQQLFSNAMVVAGLVEDPRTVVSNMNDLLTLALDKH